MARTAEARVRVALDPPAATALWTDLERWPAFVEGFARTVEVSGDWPQAGSTLVWKSGPDGRGRVSERVRELAEPGTADASGLFVTEVSEEQLSGTQTVAFHPQEEGSIVELDLTYELNQGGPLQALADVIFIRRALRDALRRTLIHFAIEAEEDAQGA